MRLSCIRILCVVFLFGFTVVNLKSQNYRIRKYSEIEGLSQDYIYDITQDKKGFLWLATGDGLSRFDGAKFKNYNLADGLAENFSTQVLVASDNTIWCGHHEGGISRLSHEGKTEKYPNGENTSSVNGIVEDKAGNIWIITQRDGIALIAPSGEIKYFKEGFEGKLLFSGGIASDGTLLVGSNEGLLIVNLTGGQPKLSGKVNEIPDTKITCVEPSLDKKAFWIGTEDAGIFYVNGKDAVKNWAIADGLPSENIQAVREDDEHNLWLAFFGKGFSKYSLISEPGKLIPTPTLNPNPLLEKEFLRVIFQDREGQIWLGTYGHGLIYLRDEIFTLHTADEPFKDAIIYSVMQDQSGKFWIGTDMGLFRYSPEKLLREAIFYSTGLGLVVEPDFVMGLKEGIPGFPIISLEQDKTGAIYGGTESAGLFRIAPESNRASKINLSIYSLSDAINYLKFDSKSNLWVGTKNGAYKIRPDGEAQYFSTMEGLPHNNIVNIQEDESGNMWLATQSQYVPVYNGKSFDKQKLKDSATVITDMTCMLRDPKDGMWVGTKGEGIYHISKEKKIRNFNARKHGLLSDYVYSLTADKAGNIWVGHRGGVSKYLPSTGKFILFDLAHGFPAGELMLNAASRDAKGNIWFGTANGFVVYNPIKDKVELKEPNTFISSVFVGDEQADLKSSIRLPYRSNRIKFDFLGLTFKDQEKVRYQYMLEGNDLQWSEMSAENSATYQGLPDGKYSFLVKACNAEGLCNQEPVRFSFVVLAPYWKRWYFLLSVIAVVVIGAYVYVQYRTAKLAQEKAVLEQAVTDRTQELKLEKDKVEALNINLERIVAERTAQLAKTNERLKQTNQELDTFIYRASHDLKQPVTSILGLVNVARLEDLSPSIAGYFSHVETAATRLDRVVTDLINVRQITQGVLVPELLDIVEQFNTVIAAQQKQSNWSKIIWEFEKPKILNFKSDRNMLDCIVSNIIDNAVKFSSPAKPTNTITIKLALQADNQLLIDIADQGTGMREDARIKAFDMFYKGVKNTGTGLGLYLTRAATMKMGGTIELESEEGKGSRIKVLLPPLPESLPEGTTYI